MGRAARKLCARSWLVLLVLAPGCVDASPPELPADAQFCQALCRESARCGANVDSSCTTSCREENWIFFSRFDPQALAGVARCLPSQSCAEIAEEVFFDQCMDQVVPELAPTEGVVRFCEVISPVWFDCGYLADVDECMTTMRGFSTWVLDQAAGCVGRTCDEVNQCLTSVFQG